jgi:hypothetical protein
MLDYPNSQSRTSHRAITVRLEDDEVEDVVLDIVRARGVLGKQEGLSIAERLLAVVNLWE